MKLLQKMALLLLVSNVTMNAQVGINTTTPTQELDVNGDLRVRGLGNSKGKTATVSALPDGTLITGYTDMTAPGIKFVGNLTSDITLDQDYNYKDIILSNELIDVNNEYNVANGRYMPKVDGYYKISMDFDMGDYTDDNKDVDILIGLWNLTTNSWVLRRTFKYQDNNNTGMTNGRNESYGISNYLQLNSTHSYIFRIFVDYDPSIASENRTARLKAYNSGSTGTSISTSFSVEKVL